MSFVHSASGRNSSSQTASMFTIKQNFLKLSFFIAEVLKDSETMFALYIQAKKHTHTHFLE